MKTPLRGLRNALPAGVVLVATLFGAAAVGRSSAPPCPTRRVLVEPDPPGSPLTLAPLTRHQRKRAKRIIAHDRRFRRIVSPESYRFGQLIPWGTLDKRPARAREVFIGTYSHAVLEPPKPLVAATWPLVSYKHGKRPAYRLWKARITVHGLRSVALHVDLKRGELVGISPDGADKIIPSLNCTPPPPPPD